MFARYCSTEQKILDFSFVGKSRVIHLQWEDLSRSTDTRVLSHRRGVRRVGVAVGRLSLTHHMIYKHYANEESDMS